MVGGGGERHKKGKKENARLQGKVALITVFSLSGFFYFIPESTEAMAKKV